jgi:Ser/Thr protein kinase RdoA (MazF antagonist)
MLGSIPLRDPAWDGIAPVDATFSCPVSPNTSAWMSAQAAASFLPPPVHVLGQLRERGGDQRVGHFLIGCQTGWFVVHVKNSRSAGDVASAAALSDRLLAAGLPVARYSRTASKEPEIVIDGLAVTVTDYVPARHRSECVEDAIAVGAALARLHVALRHDPEAGMIEVRNVEVRKRLTQVAGLLASAHNAIPAPYQAMVRAAAARLDATYAFAGPSQRLHGDITPGNVLYLADGSARICDFENSAFSYWPVAFDVASAVLRFCMEPIDPMLTSPNANAIELREALISAYAKESGQLPDASILDRAIRNLVDHNIVVRSMYDMEMDMHSKGEWRKIARLDRLAQDVWEDA